MVTMSKIIHIMYTYVDFYSCVNLADCPAGWKVNRGSCYKKFNKRYSWDDARALCMKEKSDLADVNNGEENTFVTMFGGKNWLGFFVCEISLAINGLKICNVESNEINWDRFKSGQPDYRPKRRFENGSPLKNTDYRVMINDDGIWTDEPKNDKHSYICKKPGIIIIHESIHGYLLLKCPQLKLLN